MQNVKKTIKHSICKVHFCISSLVLAFNLKNFAAELANYDYSLTGHLSFTTPTAVLHVPVGVSRGYTDYIKAEAIHEADSRIH